MATDSFAHLPTDILARAILPREPSLSGDAAEALLAMRFSATDRQRMEVLLAKASAGTLTPEEAAEGEALDQVGHLLAMLHSKARLSLEHRHPSS